MRPTLGALAAIATTLAWALSSTRPQKLLRCLFRAEKLSRLGVETRTLWGIPVSSGGVRSVMGAIEPFISLYRTGAALGIDLFRFLGASLRFRTALTAENLSSQTVGALPKAAGKPPARLGSDSS